MNRAFILRPGKSFLIALTIFFAGTGVFAQNPAVLPLTDSLFATSPALTADTLISDNGHFPETRFRKINALRIKAAEKPALVAAGIGVLGITIYKVGDEPLRRFAMDHQYETATEVSGYVRELGRSSNMMLVAGGTYATGLVFRNQKIQRTGILLISSLIINDLVTGKLKNQFQRRRPDITPHNFYFDGEHGSGQNVSLPSWHTSTAFTVATTVATVYGNHKWVAPVAYGTATLVGLSRVYDNKHWMTDVMAGAAIGYLTAKGTNYLLKQAERQLEKKKINIYLSPSVSPQRVGLNFGGSF